ncbi:MAG: hypothetical protein ACRDP1_02860 [Nocardioidaceae bacterium]
MRRSADIPSELLGGPFRRRDAEKAGISRRMLQGGRFRRLTHDVYAPAELADDALVLARALQLANPAAVISHASAGVSWLLPVPEGTVAHVTVPKGRLRSIVSCEAIVHESRRPESQQQGDWWVTPPARTFTDLPACHGLSDVVACGDALVRQGVCSAEDLVLAARECPRPGARRSRAAAALVRPGVDAATETRLRLLMVLSGLPEPVTNRDVFDSLGAWVARPDLSYPDYLIAIGTTADGTPLTIGNGRRTSIGGSTTTAPAGGWLS